VNLPLKIYFVLLSVTACPVMAEQPMKHPGPSPLIQSAPTPIIPSSNPTPATPNKLGDNKTQAVTPAIIYTYTADRFADPFLVSKTGGPQTLLQPFDPIGTELGGIISTSSGKIAVLRTLGGAIFIVKRGRLINAIGRTAPGYGAQISGLSVVVWPTSSKSTRYTYKLRSSNEEGTLK